MLLAMAWRNIWRNRNRSLIIIFSVAVGFFAGMFVLAIYSGMVRGRIQTVIENEVSHLQLHHPRFKSDFEAGYTLPDANRVLHQVKVTRGVGRVTIRSIAHGMLATGSGSSGVEIRGVVPAPEKAVSALDQKIVLGRYFPSEKKNELLVGRKLFDKMKLKLNSKVVLTFTNKENIITAGAFRIAGVYHTTNTPMEEHTVYVTISDLNALLEIGNEFHELAVLLQRDDDLEAVKEQLQRSYPTVLVETWKEISPETEMTVATTNQFSLIIVAVIMLALAFGIVNTMLMAILERTRETGMMMALGMNKRKLFVLVLLETVFLTLLGVPVGLVIAWSAIHYTARHGIDVSAFAREAMEQFGYDAVIYPQFPAHQLGAVLLIVTATAVLSSVFPALKALQLRPVEALRN